MLNRTLPGKHSFAHRAMLAGLACWLAVVSLFANPLPVHAATLTINSTGDALPAMVETPWSRTFTASGGTGPYPCSISGTLPEGMAFSTSTCQLSGAPRDFGSYPVVISFTDAGDADNSGSLVLTFTAEVETQITTTLRSTHPDGETNYIAGFPIWVEAGVDFDPAISGKSPAGTVSVSSGAGGPTCSITLDENGAGQCALIFPTAGKKTVLATFSPGEAGVRSSTTSSVVQVEAMRVTPSLSAGRNHTCYLASDGLMTCWGLEDALPVDGNGDLIVTGPFTRISTGGYQTCGLNVDGTIACWGDNTDVTANVPDGKYVDISAGDEHVCAIDTANQLHCWGNMSAELQAVPNVRVKSVSAGVDFDCAIRKNNSQPVCWGSLTGAPATALKALAVGNTHACAVRTDGALQCWGSPTMTVPEGTSFSEIDSGSAYSCAHKSDGTIACWGSGSPTVDSSAVFDQFSSGFLHTCALKPNGGAQTLSCWGENAYDKTPAPRISLGPTSIPQYLVSAKTFSQTFASSGGTTPYTISVASGSLPAGLSLNAATLAGTLGTPGVYSFVLSAAETFPGGSLPLQLSPALVSYSTTVIDGATTTAITLPAQASAGSPVAAQVVVSGIPSLPVVTGVVLISSGSSYCQAEVGAGGTAQCTLYFDQPGVQTVTAQYQGDQYFSPSTQTGTITVNPVVITPSIGAGNQFSCSIDGTGHLSCWGKVSSFQVPVPTTGVYDQLDLGESHACALGLNRQAACWGWDGYNAATPPAVTGIAKVTAGGDFTCALTVSGGITCWGRSDSNRLAVPALGGGVTYTDVDAGTDHTCAVDTAGAVHCWGASDAEGKTTVPSDLLTRGKVTKISSGKTFSCGLHEDGSLECWGGIGILDSIRTEPAGVFTAVSAGGDFACALDASGGVSCWGALTSAPAGTFTRIAAGYDHACGILSTGKMLCWGDNDLGQAPVVSLSPTSVPTIDVESPWTTSINASGGRAAQYTYSVSGGALPAGLSLNTNTGVISGTPTQAGFVSFTIQAQELNLTPAISAARTYTQTIRGKVVAAVDSALPAGAVVGRPVQVAFSVQPLPGNAMGALPTGKVTVSAPGNRCEVDLVDGAGSCVMLFGAAGTKTITISYPGDELYQPDDSLAADFEYQVIPFRQPLQLRTGLTQTYIYNADGSSGCIGEPCVLNGTYTRLEVGDLYSCGLQPDGILVCRTNTDIPSASPVFNSGPYIDMSVGKAHVCALKIDGQAECQGDNASGQSSPPAGIFNALSAGGGHTCALEEDGEAVCWGEITTPPAGAFIQLVSGDAYTCGMRSDGSLSCWGASSLGALTMPDSPSTFRQVAAGGAQTCGLDADGQVLCWPVDAPGDSYTVHGEFIALAVYDDHVCALRAGLKLTCWGENDAGEAPQFAFDPLEEDAIPAAKYFEHAFNIAGGVKPLTAEVVSGHLPPGLAAGIEPTLAPGLLSGAILQNLGPAGMILYGTPTTPGVYPFVIRWTDVSAYPLVMEQPYSLTVTGGDLSVDLIPYSTAGALQGLEYGFKVTATNKTGLAFPGGVVLTIDLPDGFENVAADSADCALSAAKLTCALGSMDPAEWITISVMGLVTAESGETLEFRTSLDSTLADWPEISAQDNTDRLAVSVADQSAVFDDDFTQPPYAWSGGTLETAPGLATFLSVQDAGDLLLDLSGIPAHKNVRISFDLYIIGGWLGNNPTGSPSEWMFGIAGDPPLLRTTFSNDPALPQAYPGAYPGSAIPARWGGDGVDELGYERAGSPLPDTRYYLSYQFAHTTGELHLLFRSLNLPDGAWWGVDNVKVEIGSGRSRIFLPLAQR